MRSKDCKSLILIFFLLPTLTACAERKEMTLARKDFLAGKPGLNIYSDKNPGETKTLKRPYKFSPPFIPHSIKADIINANINSCLECHQEGLELSQGHVATKVPFSHYTNSKIRGMNYNCLQCHVHQTEEKPRVF